MSGTEMSTRAIELSVERPRGRAKRLSRSTSLLGLTPLVVLLAGWQIFGQDRSPYFPRPSTWVAAIVGVWESGVLQPAIWATISSFLLAFVLASVIGVAVGIPVGRSRLADRLTGPMFELFRALPAAAVVPIAVLFGGYTEKMKIVVVVFAAVWPILLTVQASARGLPAARLDLGRSLRLTRGQNLVKILMPSLFPSVLLGIRVAAPTVLIIVLLVEIITQIPGLGGVLSVAQQNYQAALVYGITAISAILGLIVNIAVSSIESIALRYEPKIDD